MRANREDLIQKGILLPDTPTSAPPSANVGDAPGQCCHLHTRRCARGCSRMRGAAERHLSHVANSCPLFYSHGVYCNWSTSVVDDLPIPRERGAQVSGKGVAIVLPSGTPQIRATMVGRSKSGERGDELFSTSNPLTYARFLEYVF